MARGSSVTHGMNIADCEKGATALGTLGDDIASLLAALKKETASTDAFWVGPDADRFRSAEWAEIETGFTAIIASIRQLRDDLRRNIAQQKAASA